MEEAFSPQAIILAKARSTMLSQVFACVMPVMRALTESPEDTESPEGSTEVEVWIFWYH